MPLDTWTVAALADEIENTLLGGRVQQIVQIDAGSLGFEIYNAGQRRYLLASANRQAPRLHLLDDKPRRGVDTPSPILQLLRKFVRTGWLAGVRQPPWERVLELTFDHAEYGESRLMVELIGRWANLLLLRPPRQAGDAEALRILDCVHRVRPEDAEARRLLPGQIYEPPPAQQGWPPDQLTELRLRLRLEEAEPAAPLWRVLLDGLAGLSPALAREIVYRATGNARTRAGEFARLTPLLEATAAMVALLDQGDWQPGLLLDDQGQPADYSPYRLEHRLAEGLRWQPADSISAAAMLYYARPEASAGVPAPVQSDSYASARQQVAGQIERMRNKLQRRLEAIGRELRSDEEIEQLRQAGQWILALATQIRPRQAELKLPDGAGLETDIIQLDPALSAADNASVYFKRYRKAKRARLVAGPRIAETEAELAYLAQLAADLVLASNRPEIDAVRAALVEAGFVRPPKTRILDQIKGPRRLVSQEGYAILVGRNSQQNERITFEMAGPDDLWLHARGWPGSHVVIRNAGRPVSEETLHYAAGLAAFFSKARSESWVDVIATERRHVHRAPGHRLGMVLLKQETAVRVRPQRPSVSET